MNFQFKKKNESFFSLDNEHRDIARRSPDHFRFFDLSFLKRTLFFKFFSAIHRENLPLIDNMNQIKLKISLK